MWNSNLLKWIVFASILLKQFCIFLTYRMIMLCLSRCELRQGVSGMTDEEIRNLLVLAAQVTTTTTPAPTTTAPNLPPLVLNIPNAPCRPLVPCPAGTTPKISPINGRCQCMLQFSFPRLPQLRRRRQALERRRLLRNAGRV